LASPLSDIVRKILTLKRRMLIEVGWPREALLLAPSCMAQMAKVMLC